MPITKKKTPFELPYFNSTNYPLAVKGQLDQDEFIEEESKILRYHQFIVKEFFTRNPHQRGMLICHGMGLGKTRLAVSISTYYLEFDPQRRIIILSAKSLATNFRSEVISFTGKNDDYVDRNYKFVSLNSSNMFKQMSNIDKDIDSINLEKRLGNFMDDVVRDSALEGSMLIIDEAHNLFNSITNGAKNAVALYDLIMETKNIKLIFMSGTPIINDPFELVPCYNMLRGAIEIDTKEGGDDDDASNDDNAEPGITNDELNNAEEVESFVDNIDADDEADDIEDRQEAKYDQETHTNKPEYKGPKTKKMSSSSQKSGRNNDIRRGDKFANRRRDPEKEKRRNKNTIRTTLFSEDTTEFEHFFVDVEKKTIKNKDKFTNRIFGLSSYYGDLYFPSTKDKPGFPKELETIVERVPMSQTQFARYISARILEQEETKRGFKAQDSRFSSASGGSSTYRVKSRQISNYCIPEYALGPVRGSKSREKFIHKITIEDLQNLEEFSPKMARIMANIEKHGNQLGIVYSQFVSGEGIAIFARALEALGYTRYGGNRGSTESDFGLKEKSHNRFAILSGDITPEERANIIVQFNSVENIDGSVIQLLLLSGAVAEGIDLKRIRHVHVMEPFWNYARINQVKTRAIRYMSHKDLPIADQNVQVYIYLSDYPLNHPKKKIIEATTDNDLYDKSIDNMQIINTFMLAIAEASIDCSMHYPKLTDDVKERLKCKLCSPDNQALYHPILKKDMDLPSTCRPYSEQKIKVSEIVLPGSNEKFYYKKESADKENNLDVKLYHFNKKLNGYAPLLRTHPLYGDLMAAILMKDN
jgi:hypothetical protein